MFLLDFNGIFFFLFFPFFLEITGGHDFRGRRRHRATVGSFFGEMTAGGSVFSHTEFFFLMMIIFLKKL